MTSLRSATGCFACKTRHKKCDETKPHCLRCQKSRIECPGYTYVKHSNKPNGKLRTLPAPRPRVGLSRAAAHQGTLTDTPEPIQQVQGQLAPDNDLMAFRALNSVPNVSLRTQSERTDDSDKWVHSSSFNGPFQRSLDHLSTSHGFVGNTSDHTSVLASARSTVKPMTPGQASLLAALFSLGQPPDLDPLLQRAQPTTELLLDPNVPRLSSETKRLDGITTEYNGDQEGPLDTVHRELALDKTAESNALPFVLQRYIAWIGRMAFEPRKLTHIARDFVFSHFEDGEGSRLIVVLLANIGSATRSFELVQALSNPTHTMLHNAVRHRLEAVKSFDNPPRHVLAKALDAAVQTMLLHFLVSRLKDALILREAAAPIFQQLCPEPHGAVINLPSVLKNPLRCLGHFAHIDLHYSLSADVPTSFRYEVITSDSQPSDSSQLVRTNQDDGFLQWLHGTPDSMILLFAKLKLFQQDGLVPNEETIASLEREIDEFQPDSGMSSERFLALMHLAVEECWRQTAYIYLYMAVCGDSSGTPRVKEAMKRYMRLVEGFKPGRLPDDFLLNNLILVTPAAQRDHDRNVIKQRIIGIFSRGRLFSESHNIIWIIEDCWTRADAEGRQVVWSDVAVSRNRMVGALIRGPLSTAKAQQ